MNGAELVQEAAVTELLRLEQAGAKTAVIVVRDDVSSPALVDALELLARSSKLTVSVAG